MSERLPAMPTNVRRLGCQSLIAAKPVSLALQWLLFKEILAERVGFELESKDVQSRPRTTINID